MSEIQTYRVEIEQMLHGYDRGHRELAGSMELDEHARASMLLMSDLLTDEALDESSSYLCCYPLRSISRHVLARTWLAGRAYRPGSVWTHSLLLDYQTLAQLPDLTCLEQLFRRPQDDTTRPYEVRLDATLTSRPSQPEPVSSAAAIAIAQLYGDTRSVVLLPAADQAANDRLAMVLWRQMWPSQRRDLAFVTAVSGPSTPSVAGCSLRFVRGAFQGVDLDRGQSALLEDLPQPGPTNLRTFLARYVGESGDPRRVAPALAAIWNDGSDKELAPFAALARSEGLNRLKRDLIASTFNQRADPIALVGLIREFGNEPRATLPEAVTSALSQLNDRLAGEVLAIGLRAAEDSLARQTAEIITSNRPAQLVLAAIPPADRPALLALRPDLAHSPAFWPREDILAARLLRALPANHPIDLDSTLAALGDIPGEQTAVALTERFLRSDNPSASLRLLNHESDKLGKTAAERIVRVASLLKTVLQSNPNQPALTKLANAIVEAQMPIDSPDEWIAAASATGIDSRFDRSVFCLVLSVAALTSSDEEQGIVIARFVVDRLMSDIRRYRLALSEERWLTRNLPATPAAWSLRSRLASAIISRWPPHPGHAAGLTVANDRENVDELVTAALTNLDNITLFDALTADDLPPSATPRILEKLSPPRFRWTFW